MWKHILVQGCYQILVLFLVIFGGPKLIGDYAVWPLPFKRQLKHHTTLHLQPCTGSAGGRVCLQVRVTLLP